METIEAVPVVLFATFAVYKLLPLVIMGFRPRAISQRFVRLGNSDPIPGNETIHQLVARLKEAGFTLLGIKVEKLPLWGTAFQELTLASPASCCFVSIPLRRKGQSYYFLTAFADGGTLLTANRGFFPSDDPRGLLVRFACQDILELLERHLSIVRQLQAAGRNPLEDFTPEARMQATRLFYEAPATQRQMRKIGFGVLIAWLAALFVAVQSMFGILAVPQHVPDGNSEPLLEQEAPPHP